MSTQMVVQQHFFPAEHSRRVYDYEAPASHLAKRVLEPDYWAPLINQLRKWDRIEIRSADGNGFLEVIVVGSDAAGVHLKPIRGFSLAEQVLA